MCLQWIQNERNTVPLHEPEVSVRLSPARRLPWHAQPVAHAEESHRSRSTLDQKLGGDSAAFARLLNALCRASKETMLLQKYRDACAKARAALQTLHDPKRKLTDDERRSIVLQVDDILGLSSNGSGEPEQKSEPRILNSEGSAKPEEDEPTASAPAPAPNEALSSATA